MDSKLVEIIDEACHRLLIDKSEEGKREADEFMATCMSSVHFNRLLTLNLANIAEEKEGLLRTALSVTSLSFWLGYEAGKAAALYELTKEIGASGT